MLQVANLTKIKLWKKIYKMTETLVNGYSSESTQQELPNEYQHDLVQMVFKNICFLALWTKLASASGIERHMTFYSSSNIYC